MPDTLSYYGEVIDSLAPGLQLLFGLLLAGKIMLFGSRLVYRSLVGR